MKSIHLIFLILNLLSVFETYADQPFVSYDDRFKQAELVIEGEVASIHALKFSDKGIARKVAVIEVIDKIKGELETEFVLVAIGYHWPKGQRSSQDLDIVINDYGKWLLRKEKTGLFFLNSPDDFIKLTD